MSHSLKNLELQANYAITSNDQKRLSIMAITDTSTSELTPEVHALLSSLYARAGNDSMVIRKLLYALKDISTHAKEFPLQD